MIALLSALLGFFSSAFPEFIRLFREHKDRAHEITLLHLQMEYDRQKLHAAHQAQREEQAYKLEAIALERDMRESADLNHRPDGTGEHKTGLWVVDALSGSVRPVITYLLFTLYACVKYAQYHLLVSPALPWQAPITHMQALVSLWTQDDMAVFTAIIAFWFGSRMFRKGRFA